MERYRKRELTENRANVVTCPSALSLPRYRDHDRDLLGEEYSVSVVHDARIFHDPSERLESFASIPSPPPDAASLLICNPLCK